MVAKRVLITGANRGLGLEFVKQLLSAPDAPEVLFATCRNPKDAIQLDSVVRCAKHTKSHILKLDVTSEASLKAIADFVIKQCGSDGLNLLINNVGIFDQSILKLEDVQAQSMLEHFVTNTASPTLLTSFLLPALRNAANKQNGTDMKVSRAAVVHIGAFLALIGEGTKILWNGYCGLLPYRASKAALNMMAACMASDLRKDNILVIPIHPGWVRTDMGGPHGDISVEESVTAVLNVLRNASTKDSGVFCAYDGRVFNEW